jgi:hypothetical protein
MRIRTTLAAALTAAAILAHSAQAAAQGCILLRQTSPLFNTSSLDADVGSWTVTLTGRNSTADIHYRGTERQFQRETEQTYVVNRQNAMTATIGYQLSPRISLNVGIPYVEASWGIPSPRAGGPSTRANENARGLGDITTLARVSLFNPATTDRSWNLIVGGGVKFPTGNSSATDVFPDSNGNNNLERHVDISVNPGDGGWGYIADLQLYKQVSRFTVFGSGTWLLNPKDTAALARGTLVTVTSTTSPTGVNTVSDQYVFRAGTQATIWNNISGSIAWRMEGVPRYDLIGDSHGFRRPGKTMYWEPGLTFSYGNHSVSMNVPVGYYFNRTPNPYTNSAGDSTFPEYVAIATYSMRFGGKSMKHSQPAVTDQPGTPRTPEVVRPGEGE